MSTTNCDECGELEHYETEETSILCQDWHYRHQECFRGSDEPWALLGKHPTLRQIQESLYLQVVWARLHYLTQLEASTVDDMLKWEGKRCDSFYKDHFVIEITICNHIPWFIHFYPTTVDPLCNDTRFGASLLERHEPGRRFLKECDKLFDLDIERDFTYCNATVLNEVNDKVLGTGDVMNSRYGD